MLDNLGTVSVSGVNSVLAARYTARPGRQPSQATVDIVPQPGTTFDAVSLEMAFGGSRITLPDCKVSQVTFAFSEQGTIWRLHLVDRRWRWSFGQISGRYNLRADDDTLIQSTERNPRQLAQLCLQAMGEQDADLDELPNDLRPLVEWDYENPAKMLERLARDGNCRIVIGGENRVRLRSMDAGAAAPLSASALNSAQASVGQLAPDRLAVFTGRLRIQCDFRLEAIGLDVDQEVRPVDELSYRPYDGWSAIDLEHFQSITDLRARELAKQSVFRWYRIRTPCELPTQGTLTDLNRIVPLEAEQVERIQTAGTAKNRPAIVFGVWAHYPHQAENRTTRLRPLSADPRTIVTTPFELDRERGLVKFAQPVLQYAEGPYPVAAELVLRTAVGVRDENNRTWKRLERTRDLNGNGQTTEYLSAEQLTPVVVPQYDADTYAVTGTTDNFADVNHQADLVLDETTRRYLNHKPQRVIYAGLLPFEPDGEINAVTWSIGPEGTTTEVARHQHELLVVPARRPHAGELDTLRGRRNLRHQPVI